MNFSCYDDKARENLALGRPSATPTCHKTRFLRDTTHNHSSLRKRESDITAAIASKHVESIEISQQLSYAFHSIITVSVIHYFAITGIIHLVCIVLQIHRIHLLQRAVARISEIIRQLLTRIGRHLTSPRK